MVISNNAQDTNTLEKIILVCLLKNRNVCSRCVSKENVAFFFKSKPVKLHSKMFDASQKVRPSLFFTSPPSHTSFSRRRGYLEVSVGHSAPSSPRQKWGLECPHVRCRSGDPMEPPGPRQPQDLPCISTQPRERGEGSGQTERGFNLQLSLLQQLKDAGVGNHELGIKFA